ncbi:MAG: HD domain-containing protein [Flavobacteriia bacterium]|nr:HD domain-containing protein [Flavobacteriia bacterium]
MEGSHDWFHIERVLKMSQFIQSKEGGDFELISLTALLHDIADHKYNNYNFEIGATKAFDLLMSEGANQELAEKVASLINIISFKGGDVSDQETSLEGKIVRDADRLDAIGAIGIARAFAYGGVNHFYEKLLLLKDRMETNTAKEIAEKRHEIMLKFLDEFQKEWNLSV